MANFKYNDPLANKALGFANYGRTDMAPRIASSYNMNPRGGFQPFAPSQLSFLGDDAGFSMPGPTFPQDQFFNEYQDGINLRAQSGGDPFGRYQFGYDTLGAPDASAQGIRPYEGFQGIDFNQDGVVSTEDPFIGPTGAAEFRTQSEIGAPVTEAPPELRAVPAAAAATTATGTAATSTAATGITGTGSEADLIRAGAESRAMKSAGAATGVGQIVGGVMNITQGVRALKDVNINAAQAAVDAAYATRPGLGTPSEFYQMQKEAYDQRLVAMRLEDINRGLATNVAAAQQFGARGLGSTLAATAQAQRAQQREVLQQQRLQTSALGALASAREREIQRREQRATFDIGIAFDQLKAEQAREQFARQQIAQGIVGTAAGLTRTAVTFGAEQGAKVTPGEFSHDTNPIDIVQEGTKIGEMTGGEYIFNPQQAGKMAREAKKGNSPLHKFVRKTLNKFHKDAEKYEGK